MATFALFVELFSFLAHIPRTVAAGDTDEVRATTYVVMGKSLLNLLKFHSKHFLLEELLCTPL